MKMTPALAEICGIHAGDGYMRNSGHRWELDISGGMDEVEYYDNHVSKLFKTAFGVDIQTREFPKRFTYGFVLRDKSVIRAIHELGFPYGAKTNTLRVPKSILESDDLKIIKAFLRGLFDTDGSLTFDKGYGKYVEFKRTHHVFPRIIISTVSPKFFEDIKILLDKLGVVYAVQVVTPKPKNEKTAYRVWIRSNNAIKWMEDVGSGNSSKMSRFLIWKEYGFCPPWTSFEQRKQILNKELDPNSFYNGLVA